MKAAVAVVAAIAISIAGGACHRTSSSQSSNTSSSSTQAADDKAGDIAFLQNMVAHHQQTLELAALVPAQSSNPAMVLLAEQLAAQQRTEMQGCQAQLLQWEVPGAVPPGPEALAAIPGMVDQGTVDQLRGLHGPAFDKLWLQTMIPHYRGAITLAHNEIQDGDSADVISIAQSLLPRQQDQIDQMTSALEAL